MANLNPSHDAEVFVAVTKELLGNEEVLLSTTSSGDKLPPRVIELSKDRRLESLKKFQDELRTRPERRKGCIQLTSVDSFIETAERFKNPDSVIFADYNTKSARLLAVFDYHPIGGVLRGTTVEEATVKAEPQLTGEALAKLNEPGNAGAAVSWPKQLPEEVSADFCQFRAAYEFPVSEEWIRWRDMNEKPFTQEAFAQFIEDNIMSVAAPYRALERARQIAAQLNITYCDAARLMSLSRELVVTAESKYTQIVNQQTGETKISFEEVHEGEGGATLDIPGGFLLNLPVFVDSQPFQIVARLRYRKAGQKITWHYSIYRMDQVFELAIKDEAMRIKKATGLPVLLGRPGGKQQTDE